jgi:hypothetical protein
MKKIVFMLTACLAVGAFASDIVLDIMLNGQWQEDGSRSGKIRERGILVIEDVGAETNVYNGTFYFLESRGKKGKAQVDSMEEAEVYLLWGDKYSFGMMVDIEGAQMSGIGKAIPDGEGGYRQIIIPSGHGAFIYSAFDEEVTTPPGTNSVAETNEVIAELQVGRMYARLNRRLTEEANDSDGETVVEEWYDVKPGKGKKK